MLGAAVCEQRGSQGEEKPGLRLGTGTSRAVVGTDCEGRSPCDQRAMSVSVASNGVHPGEGLESSVYSQVQRVRAQGVQGSE